jgi:aspartate racemase
MSTSHPERLRPLGLVGGMSWHSTATYYRRVNERVAEARSAHSSARISLQSLDFSEVRECQLADDYARSGRMLAEAGRACVAGGAEVLAICTNLLHRNYDDLTAAVDVPVLHIADAVAQAALRAGHRTVGLLGTRPVMELDFYATRLAAHGLEVVVPDEANRVEVDRVVFEEITRGRFLEPSRQRYVEVMGDLAARGADVVALACTEIGLLVPQASSPLPVVDTALVHADLLADLALDPTMPVPGRTPVTA